MPPPTRGQLLHELLTRWEQVHRRRAYGGLWALAGFALQAGVYLSRFFLRLREGRAEPGELAEMERLSDVLSPEDGRIRLIQVKRTLHKPALIAAVEEAYRITDLCRRDVPALLPHLRFQVACGKRDTRLGPHDLGLPEVIPRGGDPECWGLMLARFDPDAPVLEQPDPLDHLHVLLWHEGLQDTAGFIKGCLGEMLSHLEEPHRVRDLGRALASRFHEAPRREPWPAQGRILTVDDVRPSPEAATSTRVLTGQVPRLADLCEGCFRQRTPIFEALCRAFDGWLAGLPAAEKVPVFWIDGRSGDGKSVLLLQWIADLLGQPHPAPLVMLGSGEELPGLMSALPDRREVIRELYRKHVALHGGWPSDRLHDMLVAWLRGNYRGPRYGKVLGALASRPKQWAAVADRLPAEVVADFEDWSSR